MLDGPRIGDHDLDPARLVQCERDIETVGARRLQHDPHRTAALREPPHELAVAGRIVVEPRDLEPLGIPAHRHVEHELADVDSHLGRLEHRSPPAVVSRSGPPDPAPSAYHACGCRLLASDTPRHRRRGRGAYLTNRLTASRRLGLPGAPLRAYTAKASD